MRGAIVDLGEVTMMARAYSEATGAPVSRIVRACVEREIGAQLATNPGVRERYEHAMRLLGRRRAPLRVIK